MTDGPLCTVPHSRHLALCPDGARVVDASHGIVTEVATGRRIATCELLANTISVAWSPDGESILATNTGGQTVQCDAGTGARLRTLELSAAAFARDGKTMVGGDREGNLFVQDARTGIERARRSEPETLITAVDASLEGRVVAVATRLGVGGSTIAAWTPEVDAFTRWGLPDLVLGLACTAAHPDRAQVFGTTWIASLDLTTGLLSERTPYEHVEALADSPDGRYLAVTERKRFRLTDGKVSAVKPLRSAWGPVSFSTDGRRVALASANEGEVWDLQVLLRTWGASAT